MTSRLKFLLSGAGLVAGAAALRGAATSAPVRLPAGPGPGSRLARARGKRSDRIPDIVLTSHEGKKVRFFEDLVQDRKLAVNFMYTVCKGICPGMTENLLKVRHSLAAQGHTDITFVSVSIEPAKDTPQRLADYMEANEIVNRPGLPRWVFLTGSLRDIDALRKSLGVADRNPVIDADRTQHGGTLTYGNDKTDWWNAIPALTQPQYIAEAMLRTLDNQRRHPRLVASAR
ncbi:MAG: hypothetical protein RJA22_280 [Verrucomicrobiota bacterium]|jgi:protein SCO1/2